MDKDTFQSTFENFFFNVTCQVSSVQSLYESLPNLFKQDEKKTELKPWNFFSRRFFLISKKKKVLA